MGNFQLQITYVNYGLFSQKISDVKVFYCSFLSYNVFVMLIPKTYVIAYKNTPPPNRSGSIEIHLFCLMYITITALHNASRIWPPVCLPSRCAARSETRAVRSEQISRCAQSTVIWVSIYDQFSVVLRGCQDNGKIFKPMARRARPTWSKVPNNRDSPVGIWVCHWWPVEVLSYIYGILSDNRGCTASMHGRGKHRAPIQVYYC